MDKIPEGYLRDSTGALVPVANIRPERLAEDELVRELVEKALTLNEELARFRARALAEVGALRELVDEKYGVKLGGRKGNMTLSAFDGSVKIQVQISETLHFGPEIHAAKQLVDQCIIRWSEGANSNLKTIVDQAFQVNKQNRIDTARVLGLRQLDIDEPEWDRAMEAISDALRVSGSKTYIRFYQTDEHGR